MQVRRRNERIATICGNVGLIIENQLLLFILSIVLKIICKKLLMII